MSQKLSLLDDNSSDSEIELTVNKDYANRYDKWREGEELQKYKDLIKDEEDSESSSESEEVEEEFDEEFFRALSLLKGKDPRLYDKNFQLFKEKQLVKKPKTEKQKPIYMKDYERSLVLERGGKFSDEDDEENKLENVTTYNEEQENVKKSFIEAIGGSDDSESDADDLLQVKTKTKKEEEDEDADYVKWLKGEEEKEIDENVQKDLSYLKNYWNDPTLDEGEKFLRDYILNKQYLEKDDSVIPSYEEITSGMLSDDEKMIEEQEKFEHKYNFRFEEPDEEFIKRYPRTVSDSLRRVDTRRKEKREEKTERKRKEREQRREELKRLKALKRKEIEEKFMKLKEISGQDEINLKESDIESDFDPDKHDQRMNEMFNDEYYQVEEEQKPEFPYDEELDSENWNAWAGEKIIEENEEDKNLSDEDENSNNQNESTTNPKDEFANEMINASRPKKKVKKKSLFAKIISQPKPVYDPDGKSFEEYLDEYYKLDYEDIVGDMPVRYKYRKVIPNDFGLSIDEILTADDKELNRWCSVKKTCQYRNEDEELYDVQAFRKKAQIPQIKIKCLPSVFAPKDDDDDTNVSDCKQSKKKRVDNQMNNKADNSEKNDVESESTPQFSKSENIIQSTDENLDSSLEIKKHKKKSKKKKGKLSAYISENDESTDFTLSDKNECSLVSPVSDNADEDQDVVQQQEKIKKSKKKKKHKDKQNISNSEAESEISNVIPENSYENSNVDESSVSIDSSNKSTKKKRKHSDIVSDSDEITNSHSNIVAEATVSENTSDAHPKKKKKKKRNENKNMANSQQNTSNHFHNKSSAKHKSKDKQQKFVSEDKRLGLSDERLAAYGINPKKFKNRIIYSKK